MRSRGRWEKKANIAAFCWECRLLAGSFAAEADRSSFFRRHGWRGARGAQRGERGCMTIELLCKKNIEKASGTRTRYGFCALDLFCPLYTMAMPVQVDRSRVSCTRNKNRVLVSFGCFRL